MSNGCFNAGLLALCIGAGIMAITTASSAVAEPSPAKKCLPQKIDGSGPIDFRAYKGKVVYLDYWASWCGPCRASFPFMSELQKEFANDVVIVGVSVDTDKKDAAGFLKETNPNFLIGIDTDGVCPQEFAVKGMPSTYILDRNGDLVFSHEGFRKTDPEVLRAKLTEIVGKK